MITEKTSKVVLLNEILTKVQNINYAIPVGVVGIDPEGIIVQCNKEAEKILFSNEPDFLGKRYEERLPGEVSDFVGSISGREAISGMFDIQGARVKITASVMENADQKGLILVFMREEQ